MALSLLHLLTTKATILPNRVPHANCWFYMQLIQNGASEILTLLYISGDDSAEVDVTRTTGPDLWRAEEVQHED